MICSCRHSFQPSAATYRGTQLFSDHETGQPWLYTLLHNCPSCGSTRCLVMYCNEPEEEELAAE